MARWKKMVSGKYTAKKKSKEFEKILKKVEKDYPNRSGADQYKIAMGIFKRTKYYKRSGFEPTESEKEYYYPAFKEGRYGY
jgi:hypothetical protein